MADNSTKGCKRPDRRPCRAGVPARCILNRARRILRNAGKDIPSKSTMLVKRAQKVDPKARLVLNGRAAVVA